MEFVNVYRNKHEVARAYMHDDLLQPSVTPRGKSRRDRDASEGCIHGRVVRAFAHRQSRDEHWPIAYCEECFSVLAGRDPLLRGRRPRSKSDARHVVDSRWKKQWPKRGRPRQDSPAPTTVWPDLA